MHNALKKKRRCGKLVVCRSIHMMRRKSNGTEVPRRNEENYE